MQIFIPALLFSTGVLAASTVEMIVDAYQNNYLMPQFGEQLTEKRAYALQSQAVSLILDGRKVKGYKAGLTVIPGCPWH